MYHVLIFHKAGRYRLDLAAAAAAGEAENGSAEEASFETLDDLVDFAAGHDLRVEGDEVTLQEPVACAVPEPPATQNGVSSEGTVGIG